MTPDGVTESGTLDGTKFIATPTGATSIKRLKSGIFPKFISHRIGTIKDIAPPKRVSLAYFTKVKLPPSTGPSDNGQC